MRNGVSGFLAGVVVGVFVGLGMAVLARTTFEHCHVVAAGVATPSQGGPGVSWTDSQCASGLWRAYHDDGFSVKVP